MNCNILFQVTDLLHMAAFIADECSLNINSQNLMLLMIPFFFSYDNKIYMSTQFHTKCWKVLY